MPDFLICGSYGYTGSLLVEQALKSGFRPLLAGRDAEKLAAQARNFGLPVWVARLGCDLKVALRNSKGSKETTNEKDLH